MSRKDYDFRIEAKNALSKGANSIGESWSKSTWETSERLLTTFDENLKKKMLAFVNLFFGINTSNITENEYRTLGDDFSQSLIERLLKEKIISNINNNNDEIIKQKHKKKDNKKHKTEKKADIIKRENSWNIINKELDNVIKSFNFDDDFYIPSALSSKFIEIRGVGFLLCCKYLIKNQKKFLGKQSKLLFVNNIIVGTQKYINISRNFYGNSIIDSSTNLLPSSKFLDIIELNINELKSIYNFNGMKICTDTPQLLIYTDYDNFIPSKTSSLYPHQINLMESVYNTINKNEALLISLRTMTGTGKTTSACGIAEIINCFRKYSDKKDLMFIFCCNIRQVMDQVAQLVYNSNIPFGIAIIDHYIGLKEINNYNCKSDTDRVVTICGPEACIELLKKYPNTVLFLDEPTIGLDHKTDIAKINVKLISEYLPKWTILSSATLPQILPSWIIDSHELKYGKTNFIDIYSNKIHISCEIKTFDEELLIPHSKSNTCEELSKTIDRIKQNPFIGRTYTANMTNELYKIISKENINVPDIKSIFNNTDNLNADSLRGISMDMLCTVSLTSDDNKVNKICSTKINPRSVDKFEDKKTIKNSDIVWEKEQKFSVDNFIDFKQLCTKMAHRFMRPTLIATINPVLFVNEYFSDLVNDFTEHFGTVKQINDNYYNVLNLWQKQFDRVQKNMTDSSISCKEDRLRSEENIMLSKPILKVSGFQINTVEHIRKYAKYTKNIIDKSSIRAEIDATEILTTDMDVPDYIRILLACGVGIIGKYSGLYTSIVNKLMNDGKIAFIVADSSIAYGTNVPINNVIVTKDFSDTHSINTVYQLISRAGRVGRSWIAEAFIDSSCSSKILDSVSTNDITYNVELINLEELHSELLSNSINIDENLILKIARKKAQENEEKRLEIERIKKDEVEKIKKEEAEKLKLDEEKLKKEEAKKLKMNDEKKKLEELRQRRNGYNKTVQLSHVLTNPPKKINNDTNNILSGFQRSSNGNSYRKKPN